MNIEIDNVIIKKGEHIIHFSGTISFEEIDNIKLDNKTRSNIIGSEFIDNIEEKFIKYKNRMSSRMKPLPPKDGKHQSSITKI